MIYATDPKFRKQYPNGCDIYDARGRLLLCVFACNPETGEVIRFDGSWLTGQWPAPLTVVPRKASIC